MTQRDKEEMWVEEVIERELVRYYLCKQNLQYLTSNRAIVE
jgi:hypothetical protein